MNGRNVGIKNPMFGKRRDKSPNWKGGRMISNWGYVLLRLPGHHLSDSSGYVREHRLVMEQHLGRPLQRGEIIHHINGIRDDNRIENLQLLPSRWSHTYQAGMLAAILRIKTAMISRPPLEINTEESDEII